MKPEIENV